MALLVLIMLGATLGWLASILARTEAPDFAGAAKAVDQLAEGGGADIFALNEPQPVAALRVGQPSRHALGFPSSL